MKIINNICKSYKLRVNMHRFLKIKLYLSKKNYEKLKEVMLQKCNEMIYDNTFLQDVPKQIQNKII